MMMLVRNTVLSFFEALSSPDNHVSASHPYVVKVGKKSVNATLIDTVVPNDYNSDRTKY